MTIASGHGRITCDDEVLFDGIDGAVKLQGSDDADAAFLSVEAAETQSRLRIDLGTLPELARFVLCHRYEPYWMKPRTGTTASEVTTETQMLLGQLRSGRYVLLVPLFDEPFRFFLRGKPDQHLELVGETGDSFRPGRGGLALFVASGADPFDLVRRSAKLVCARLGRGRLRIDKGLPDFVNDFGWCTWDAFYADVSVEKLRRGLESFREGGVEPRFIILDDGWQSVERRPTGELRLTAFEANQKFPNGLREVSRCAKEQFAIKRLIVWHAFQGYWGGVDENRLPGFGVMNQTRQFGEGILELTPTFNQDWWGNVVGLVAPEHIGRFYDAYHRSMAEQGVDGVKVDSQAVIEGVSQGLGGRVAVSMAYRAALEASVEKHFAGRLINCMSNNQETWYGSKSSTLLRSSIDFFPNNPGSHGAHVYTNAVVGMWFGEFMHPDWDMFQSGHVWGAYHAAARAISGGPVYCSDKPDGHDFALLRKLVCSDGSILRCDRPGLPTLDALFSDPTREDVLLKVWNKNGKGGIVGVFNARVGRGTNALLHGVARATDVEGQAGESFACFAQRAGSMRVVSRHQAVSVALGEAEFELFTFVPIENDFAPVGLVDKFNSYRAVLEQNWRDAKHCDVVLRDGGRFWAYSRVAPRTVTIDGRPTSFAHDVANGTLELEVPTTERPMLSFGW